MTDRDEPSRRQQAKRARRDAGERSADLAKTLLEIKATVLAKLELDEDLRVDVDRARAVTSHVARRRAERTLAGELRRLDDEELDAIEKRLENIRAAGAAEPELFHYAERWRARLIEEDAAAAEFPGGNVAPLPELIAKARRERETGRPPGAARALFRHVREVLEAQQRAAAIDDDE